MHLALQLVDRPVESNQMKILMTIQEWIDLGNGLV